MVFSYDTYWNHTFLGPVVMIVFMLVLFCIVVYSGWIRTRPTKQSILKTFILVIIMIVCLRPECLNLLNGGMSLLQESSADAATCSGEIEAILEPSEVFPRFRGRDAVYGHVYGADIIINSERYFAPTCGSLKVGDHVIISYLPSSHFVLSITKAETER